MLIKALIFVCLFLNKKTNFYHIKLNTYSNYIKYISNNNNIYNNTNNTGIDNRHINMHDLDDKIILKIKINLQKQILLNKLQDSSIHINKKIDLIGFNQNEVIKPNLLAGKLEKQFNFDD
jgi:hypothetical protein